MLRKLLYSRVSIILNTYRSLKEYNRAKELHTSQKKCAVLFSHHMWTLSHVPLVTEGLPFVRMICDAENARQTSNTSRRWDFVVEIANMIAC